MDILVIVQILGVITLILFVVSLQQRKKETYLLLQTAGAVLYIVQYLLTNSITGAILFSIIVIRGFVFYFYKKKDKKPSKVVLAIFMVAIVVSTYLTWQNIYSIVPFIATAAKTWGTWQDDMKWLRRTSLLGQSCMLVYNLSAAMYTGALTEACNLVSTLVAMWRYDLRKGKA